MESYLPELLSFIERKEARLLNWGITNSSFSVDEINDLIDEFSEIAASTHDADDLIDALVQRCLLIETEVETLMGLKIQYRTRMAETIRLLFSLKQLFPSSINSETWRLAPNLVSDYRLLLRSRAYPKRDLSPAQVFDETELSPIQQAVSNAILRNPRTDRPYELAQFQKDSLERILKNCGPTSPTMGTVICAGTGSGKTLAFYLPALLHLAETIDDRHYTRCLAIYPRTELLKDQFREMLAYIKLVNPILNKHGKRPLSIAVLFGDVPFNNNKKYDWWSSKEAGRICPYIDCPTCESPSVWRSQDIENDIHELYCSNCNEKVVAQGEVLLTRNSLTGRPADLLLTTTEMINEHLTDESRWGGSTYNKIFGVGAPSPDLILLDEIHTNERHTGAQIALLLRRWRHISKSRPHYVGLSATLEDAERFMADLVGVKQSQVQKVEQKYTEMQYEGMEYMVALRGDPVSSTSLLSTTIQTIMLMGRMLDGSSAVSEKIYGKKIFAFTDDLDVTNRLHFSCLDAEGRYSNGRPGKPVLANLRHPGGNDRARRNEGQIWEVCNTIEEGSLQGNGLTVGKTSSQDSGVNKDAKIIVASASLEVGYNDPDVGCVLQHKTPRGSAQFLQRKGRAGRSREMRPWTIVTLNDCGRDRVSFQNFEALFDPSLDARTLPINNTYVLRMQAVFALLEWVYLKKMKGFPTSGNIFDDFKYRPRKNDGQLDTYRQRRQFAEIETLKSVIESPNIRTELAKYLESALQQSSTVIEELLWEQPRSIMTNVIPTMLRRMETEWKNDDSHGSLLPSFIPPALFYDLNVPEITLEGAEDSTNEAMPTLRTIKEFSPGRVSKRFGVKGLKHAHWVPIALTDDDQSIQLDSFCIKSEDLGTVGYLNLSNNIEYIRCIQPRAYSLSQIPTDLSTGSNSIVHWGSQITVKYDGLNVELPHKEDICKSIESIKFFTHSYSEPLEIHRFALSAKANIRANKEDYESIVSYELDGDRIAIGSGVEVDGFSVSVKFPDDEFLLKSAKSCAVQLRDQRFTDLFRKSVEFDELRINIFQRDWMILIFQSAVLRWMNEKSCSLNEAIETVLDQKMDFSFSEIISAVYQGKGETDNQDENPTDFSERQQELILLFDNADVRKIIRSYAEVLHEDIDTSWLEWIKEKVKSTLASSIFQALFLVCPDIDQQDLQVDLFIHVNREKENDTENTIWFTEDSIGGGGAIERILRTYGDDPQRFFRLVAKVLDRSEIENTGYYINKILRSACETGNSLQGLFEKRRSSTHVNTIENSTQEILSHLTQQGYPVYHSLITAINARILRPNSSTKMDHLLLMLTNQWNCLEEVCGFEVDGRVWAYLASISSDYDSDLQTIIGSDQSLDYAHKQKIIYGLLFPRGKIYRNSQLSTYNQYGSGESAERLLLKELIQTERKTILFEDIDWHEMFKLSLSEHGCVVLQCKEEQFVDLKKEVMNHVVNPIEYNALHFFPVVTAVSRSEGEVHVEFTLKEFGK